MTPVFLSTRFFIVCTCLPRLAVPAILPGFYHRGRGNAMAARTFFGILFRCQRWRAGWPGAFVPSERGPDRDTEAAARRAARRPALRPCRSPPFVGKAAGPAQALPWSALSGSASLPVCLKDSASGKKVYTREKIFVRKRGASPGRPGGSLRNRLKGIPGLIGKSLCLGAWNSVGVPSGRSWRSSARRAPKRPPDPPPAPEPQAPVGSAPCRRTSFPLVLSFLEPAFPGLPRRHRSS